MLGVGNSHLDIISYPMQIVNNELKKFRNSCEMNSETLITS